jgi:arabinose-5-phosphate isomerase
MNDPTEARALEAFLSTAQRETEQCIGGIGGEAYAQAVDLILSAEASHNRVHITGVGKPGHVAGYVASLLSSTGTPTYFLHGTEATHGSCGQLVKGDVVICISNSGETPEMKATATAILNNGCRIIAVTGNPESWLAKHAAVHLYAGVSEEGGPLNRAPRTSILAEILVLQALSVLLQAHRDLTPAQYVKWHPGGMLGHLRADEEGEAR